MAGVFVFAAGGQVSGQDTDWNVAGPADWDTAGNWTSGVPDDLKAATIDNGGTAVIDGFDALSNSLTVGLSSGAGHLQIINGGSLTVVSTIYADGIGLGATGSVLVDASTLQQFSF